MNRIVSLVIVTILLASSAISSISIVLAQQGGGTNVSGVISTDSTWTPNGNPYNFTDTVTVAKGATLTILPSTVVNLNLANFVINGTLNAKGTDDSWIVFQGQKRLTYVWPPRIYFNSGSQPWDEATGIGSIIDHAQISVPNYQYETIIGDYPKISNNIFYNYGNDAAAIRTYGLVYNNTVIGGDRGILAQFNQSLIGNTVKDAKVGISCGYMSSDPIYFPTIIGNLLVNDTVGIEDYSNSPYIANNTIANSEKAIFLSSYTFDRGAQPQAIKYNNFVVNHYSVYVEAANSTKTVNMQDNYWGTTDTSAISQSIYDYRNDHALAKINYTPFLTSLASAPDFSNIVLNILPTPTPTPSPTSTPTSIPTPNPTSTPSQTSNPTQPPQKTTPTLQLNCKTATSYTNFRVYITGNITTLNTPIADAQVFLSYSINNGRSWLDLTAIHTDGDGAFLATWTPQVTGEYLLRASYDGSTDYSPVSTTHSFAILPYQQQNVFSVESNSTITGLTFNASSSKLSFTVTGETGTTGYVCATISKTLMPESGSIQVILDGSQIVPSIASNDDSWVVTFSYHHSSHQVAISQAQVSTNHPGVAADGSILFIAVGTTAVIVAVALIVLVKKKKSSGQ
jgi:Predicted solute binding protein